MMLTAGGCILSFIALGAALVSIMLPRDDFSPLGEYQNPGRVLNRIDGVIGPALYNNEPLVIERRRCVDRDTPVVLNRHLESVDVQPITRIELPVLNQIREEGCQTNQVGVELPPNIPTGRWVLKVEEAALDRDRIQIKPLTSEPFTVLQAPAE